MPVPTLENFLDGRFERPPGADSLNIVNPTTGAVVAHAPGSGEKDIDARSALASSVWTRDHARAPRVSKELDSGAVCINTHIPRTAEMPHGGFEYSGYGKDLSMYGVEGHTRLKHVMSSLE